MTSLGDTVTDEETDEEVDEMIQETSGDGDVWQCTVEQTDNMHVHADSQGSRHRDVPRHRQGEQGLVPRIGEHCVEAMTTAAETHAADQRGVLIHGMKSERQTCVTRRRSSLKESQSSRRG